MLMMGTTLTMLRIMTQRDSKSGKPPPTPSATIDFCQPSMTAAHTSILLTIDCSLNLLPNVPSEQQPCSQVQQRSEVDLLFRISEQMLRLFPRQPPSIPLLTPSPLLHIIITLHYIILQLGHGAYNHGIRVKNIPDVSLTPNFAGL